MSETEASAAVDVVKPDPPAVDEEAEKAAEEETKAVEEGVDNTECIAILRCS
jgi:hypothetical protein